MRIVLLIVGMVLAAVAVNALKDGSGAASPAVNAPPSPSMAEEKAAILAYKVCDQGHTVDSATNLALKAIQAQSVSPIRYVSHDANQAKYAIPYKAQNGAEKTVALNYTPSTGKVNAENDEGLAVLRMMQASC